MPNVTGNTFERHVSDHEIRGQTHGDFSVNADCAQALKRVMRAVPENWTKLSPSHRECLDLVATKIARILAGDPEFKDHWNDIEGYARLGKDRASK